MSKLVRHRTCRSCKGLLEPVFSLGQIPMNAFVKRQNETSEKIALALMSCKKCGLLQLRDTAPFKDLYVDQYWYKSGVNPVIVENLKMIAKRGARTMKKGTWIDIGSNDSTLLSFLPKRIKRVGIEPAKNLLEEAKKNADEIFCGFWEDYKGEKADVISAIGMMYDSEDPNAFVANVKAHLKPNGVFIAQLMTLDPMVKNADVGNMCHEHLLFFSYKNLADLFERHGLRIFLVEKNSINGGSYLLLVKHCFKPKKSVACPEKKPNYQDLFRRIKENREQTVNFIQAAVKAGKKVYIYGASTKMNLIVNYYGLDYKWIAGAAERNPTKLGLYMVGTGIPIVSEEEARKSADYFWIGPYGFLDHFLKREKDWRKNGGKFILSIPNFKIL